MSPSPVIADGVHRSVAEIVRRPARTDGVAVTWTPSQPKHNFTAPSIFSDAAYPPADGLSITAGLLASIIGQHAVMERLHVRETFDRSAT